MKNRKVLFVDVDPKTVIDTPFSRISEDENYEKIIEILLTEIFPFKEHRYHILDLDKTYNCVTNIEIV